MLWRVVKCVEMVGGGCGKWCLAAVMVVGAAMVVRVKCKEFVSRKRRDVPKTKKLPAPLCANVSIDASSIDQWCCGRTR